jgi:hypothetical protein
MATAITTRHLADQLKLADVLLAGRDQMWTPQDLPGRYGRVVGALDRLLQAVGGEAVVVGGWAVWRHGFLGRVTQDVDIVVAAALVEPLLRAAAVSGFEILPVRPGTWPKLRHKESDIQVDLLPENARPGTPSHPAPTRIPHPSRFGASAGGLKYIDLNGLIELKLAAGRLRDESDVVELILANPAHIDAIRQYLSGVHQEYVTRFERLLARAQEQGEL